MNKSSENLSKYGFNELNEKKKQKCTSGIFKSI